MTACNSFLKWQADYEVHHGDFDVVLMDINLEAYKTPLEEHPIKNPEFDKKAGLYIYHRLIKDGFPEENIAFLTGEENTLRDFIKDCQAASMDEPSNTFEKKPEGFEEIRKWLTQKENAKYLTLRRGIIAGYQFLKNKLAQINNGEPSAIEEQPAILQFRGFVKEENGVPVREVTIKDMQGYLESLCVLPLREPKDKQHLYKLFVRTLSHEWDAADPKLQRNKREIFTFGSIMKHVRNWITHITVLDKLSEQEVAFLFIVAMRAMFTLGIGVHQYETHLLSLFKEVPHLDIKRIPLAMTYLNVKNKLLENRGNDAFYFDAMLNNLTKTPEYGNFDYVTGLYQMFWHGIAPPKLGRDRNRDRNKVDNKSVILKYTFDTSLEYGRARRGFLYKLARSIYNRSFPYT
jgi:hypothetical protein